MINKQKLHTSNSTKTSKLDSIIANKITNKKDIQAVIKELNNPGSTSLQKRLLIKQLLRIPQRKKAQKKVRKKKENHILNQIISLNTVPFNLQFLCSQSPRKTMGEL